MSHIYGINEASAARVARIAGLCQDVVSQYAVAVDGDGRYPAESMEALAKAGFLGLCVPTEFGGMGETPGTFAAITEELAMSCASTAMIFVMHTVATQSIVGSTTLAARETVLRQIAAGEHLVTAALSERGSRSHFWAPVSRLQKTDDGYTVDAMKSWITTADHADTYMAVTQSPDGSGPMESTLFLVPRTREGVRTVASFNGLGLRGNNSSPVEFKSVAVTDADLLTTHGAGMPTMLQLILPWFNIGTSAMAHGLARACIAATSAHLQASRFEHTNEALRDLPLLRARIADMMVRTEQSRALLGYTCGELLDPSESTPMYVLSARHAAIQVAVDVTDLAMKSCGGAAFSKHLGIERYFRDARAGWVMAPTADHSAEFIGRALTGLELF